MIDRVDVVGFGRPASAAVAGAIQRAQAGRPLAPVTIIVPSNLAGIAARRAIAGGLAGTPGGLVNVSFVTVLRLAQLLAADLPSDRQPLTNPVLASAVRRALAADPRPFGEVAAHVATEAAVAACYGELSRLTPAAIDAVDADPSGAIAVSLFRRVGALLHDYDDEDAVVRRVLQRADLTAVADALGQVVWFLPERLSPAQIELVGEVLRLAPSTVIVALTGDGTADALTLATCRRAGVDVDTGDQGPLAVADHIVTVADADQEVRAVISAVIALVAKGVPLDRIGLFYPVTDPYVRIIEQQVEAAELPANGPRADRLVDCLAARCVRAALALPEEGWRRDRVMALVSGGPVRLRGRAAAPAAWERISRRAGVVAGLGDWRRKLEAFIADAAARAAEPTARGHSRAIVDGPAATDLLAFVETLAADVGAVTAARSWADKSAATGRLVDALLGGSTAHRHWPEAERDDLDRLVDALSRLSGLDDIEPRPSTDVFRRALDAELDSARAHRHPYGTGMLYGPLATAVGQDLDAVFVVGMIEGLCPTSRRDEALLPESARLLAGGELLAPDEALAQQHRSFLAALAAAPPGRRTLTMARGDLRSNRHGLPSRWLLHTASTRAGAPVYSTDFAALEASFIERVPSFAAGLSTADDSPTLAERDLATVAAFVAAGGDAAQHPASSPSGRAITMQRARRSERFTEFDGSLAGQRVASPADGVSVLSATRLESWASCGFRYFLDYVLGLDVLDDPERIVSATPLDRGTVLHDVLERFIGEAIAEGPPDPSQPWAPGARTRLHAIADECFDELAGRGRGGRPLLWAVQRGLLHGVLDRFLDDDDAHRGATGARPLRVEMSFGDRDVEPVAITLGDGRVVRFRGKIDRIDTTPSGHTVFDYKTGRTDKYKDLPLDPVLGGTALQLGLYAEAVRQLLDGHAVTSRYWRVEASDGDPRPGYLWDSDRQARFAEVLEAIVKGIEGGVFVQVPGEWSTYTRTHQNCAYCQFDHVCPVGRGEFAEAHAGDPALAVRQHLNPPMREDGS